MAHFGGYMMALFGGLKYLPTTNDMILLVSHTITVQPLVAIRHLADTNDMAPFSIYSISGCIVRVVFNQ